MDSVNLKDLIASVFHSLWSDVKRHGHTHYWLKGGRGSTKSSFISLAIVMLIVMNPRFNALVVRKVSATLRDSVYTQIEWAVGALGLERFFKFQYAPLEIVYLPTGQSIKFRGLDDPIKIKGLKFSMGYCAITWFEEADQFENMAEVRSVLQSVRRGGDKFWIFYSYNPPKTALSWVNREAIKMEAREDAIVHHSTYLDVASEHPEWIGQPFIDEAEMLKEQSPREYAWELLGEVTGTGGSVFENLVKRTITDDEIASFDNHRNGCDFGWFPDPWRFVRMDWQPSSRSLIIFEEHSRNKTLPCDTAEIIKKALTYKTRPDDAKATYHNEIVWCDDTSDGKTHMGIYRRDHGINARPAKKGNMRKLSYQWLSGLREIVIDPKRCPLTFEEFALCEYARDKNGEFMEDYTDGNDHSIDAVRYAMMNEVIRGR